MWYLIAFLFFSSAAIYFFVSILKNYIKYTVKQSMNKTEKPNNAIT